MCNHKRNVYGFAGRPIASYMTLNADGMCDWYYPNLEKRLKDQLVRLKNTILYYLERARRFRP